MDASSPMVSPSSVGLDQLESLPRYVMFILLDLISNSVPFWQVRSCSTILLTMYNVSVSLHSSPQLFSLFNAPMDGQSLCPHHCSVGFTFVHHSPSLVPLTSLSATRVANHSARRLNWSEFVSSSS